MEYLFFVAGVILFILGLVTFFKTMSFTLIFYVYTFGGLILTVWGFIALKKSHEDEVKGQTRDRVERMVGARNVPMKKCPSCSGDIESALRVCPICGYKYGVIYTLTVFTPFDTSKREGLIRYLMGRTKKNYEEISIQLEKGMVFNYSNKEDSEKSRISFESLGCKVKEGEIISNT